MASIASQIKNISFCGARAIFASPVSFIIRLLLVQPSFSSSPGHKRPVRSTWSVNINRIPRTLSFLENRISKCSSCMTALLHWIASNSLPLCSWRKKILHLSAFSIKRTACDLHLRRNVVANFGCSWEVLKLIPVLISKCQLTFWKQENEKYSFLPKKYLNNFYQHYIFAFGRIETLNFTLYAYTGYDGIGLFSYLRWDH